MKMTANTLIPAIVVGGSVLGLLAATEVNTRMNAAPEPAWRVAAREAAMNAVSYAYVDRGPSDLSPRLPWIGTGPDGSVAMFPEDFRRAKAMKLYEPAADIETDPTASAPLDAPQAIELENRAAAMAAQAVPERIERAAQRAAEVAAALPSLGTDVYERAAAPPTPTSRRIQPAVLDVPMPAPMFAGESADDSDRFGG